MKRVEHSPGPWTPHFDDPRKKKSNAQMGGPMALVATPNGRTSIDVTGSGRNFEEDCANARLIAAAPELLASLRKLLQWQAETRFAVPRIYLEEARAAVAKTEK